jgi:PAS domain S-box-containing protein
MKRKPAKPKKAAPQQAGREPAQAQLRDATWKFQAIVQAFPDLYFHLGPDGTIIDYNAGRASDLYVPPDQFLGRRMRDVLPPEVGRQFDDAIAGALARREAVTIEYALPVHGEEQHFEGRLVPFLGEHVLAVVRNVTERHRTDAALHEANQALRALIEATPLAVVAMDTAGAVTLWNPGAERLFGWRAEEAIGRLSPIIPPDKWAEFTALRDRAYRGEIVTGVDIRRRRKDGTLVDLSISVAPLRGVGGATVGVMGVFADNTDRKRAEATLRASEERYRQLFEASPQPMWVYDIERLAFLAVNDAAIRHYGYSRDEFLAMTLEDIRAPEDVPTLLASGVRAADGAHEARVYRHRRRDGTIVLDEVATHPLDFAGRKSKMVLLHDVTDRRRLEEERRLAEAALRRSEERYRAFIQQSSEAIWCFETGAPIPVDLSEGGQIACFLRDAYLSECNDAMAAMYGFTSSSEIVGARLADLMDRSDPYNERMLRDFIRSRYRLTDAETHGRGTSGEHRVFLNNLVGIVEDGRLLRAWGTQRDITAQRKAEESVRRSEESLRTFVDNAVFGVYRSTRDGKLLMANRTLARMLGYAEASEMVGEDIHKIYFDPADRDRLIRQYGTTDQYEGIETAWRRRDGTKVSVRLSGRSIHDAAGLIVNFEGVVEDMSERRALEQQLRQAQKMEAVGQLAGGMAHDFNNLLTTILTTTELMQAELPAGTRARDDLELIGMASRRGSDLIRKLLGFARRQRLDLQPIMLGTVVRDIAGVLRRVVPEDIDIQVALDEEGTGVRADPGAIEQILMNLATNARDAMPAGGTLRLEASRTTLTEEACATQGWGVPGTYAVLDVTDTGVGMDAETQLHLFEPFFTTKPVDVGTGLGLAMVYGLVRQHDGFVDITSAPGRGTTVRVLFPAADGVVPRPSPAGGMEELRGSETILLAEDEESLRRAAIRVLEKHGYRVLAAANGAEALQLYREHQAEIALLVADVVMPTLGGPQLVNELRRSRQDLKVLFTSGYTARDVQETKALDPGQPFLAKPWAVADLLRRVREVLDQPAAS